MTTIQVSSKSSLIMRIALNMIAMVVSGRAMFHDPNVVVVVLAFIMFFSSLVSALVLIVYAQWRADNGWTDTVELPDDN